MEYFGDIIYDEKIMDENKKFIIYGAGRVGQRIYKYFKINGKENSIKYFCDADASLWGKKIKGVVVGNPKQIIEENRECHFIFAGQYANEIFRSLLERGIEKIHYVWIS